MKIIFIYGAPGVGKLTTAKSLSKITGFRLLHNHLINDLVEVVYPFGTPGWRMLTRMYRRDIMKRAAEAKVQGLIFTFVYAKPTDDAYVKSIVREVAKYKAKILFVHLVCDQDQLFRRVKHPSRKPFGKIKTHKILRTVMKRHDLFSDVPYSPNLVIDNTRKSPAAAAQEIKRHYRL